MKLRMIDLHFYAPEVFLSYLIETTEGPILIETGPDSTYENLVKGLDELNYSVSDVKHIFVTHIHLDHSGAAWHFGQKGTKIYVHPRGAAHLVNPERLYASAKRIYLDEMQELWGDLEGMPEDSVVSLEDGEVVRIGDVGVTAIETLGHASHHHSYLVEDNLFTGDVGGVRLKGGPNIPPTPPPDINIEVWYESVKKMRDLNPKVVYPSHYGGYEDIDNHFDQMLQILDRLSDWVGERLKNGKTEEQMLADYKEFYKGIFNEFNSSEEAFNCLEACDPHWMNLSGLVRYWNKFRLND